MIKGKLKICVFGTNMLAFDLVNFLKKKKIETKSIITINPSKAKKNNVSDYDFDNSFLKLYKKKFFKVSNFNLESKNDIKFFKNQKFDLGLCVGWQRLLPQEILSKFKFGVFGWHGSFLKLPDGAGRSPINWSIRLGKKKIFHHLFKYDKSIDGGDIFELVKIKILPNNYISDMKLKVNKHILNSSLRLIHRIIQGKLILNKQIKKKKKIFFPKITIKDCKIYSKKMTAKVAYDLIRSASHPFPGSYLDYNSKKILIVYKSTIKKEFNKLNNQNLGTLFFYKKKLYLKLSDGLLRLDEYKFVNNKFINNKKIICD